MIFFLSHFKFALSLQTTINMSFHPLPISPPFWEKNLVDHQRVEVKEWNFIMCDEWASLRRDRGVVLRTTHLHYKEFLGEHIGNLSVILGIESNPLGTTKIKTNISPPYHPFPFEKRWALLSTCQIVSLVTSQFYLWNCLTPFLT